MLTGCRYERVIRQSINKLLDNKSSVHRILSKIIASYSHTTEVKPGCLLLSKRKEFFIVKHVLSPHWVTGYFCPPRMEFLDFNILYHPDLRRRTRIIKKRLFQPFGAAMVRCRSKQFRFHTKHEQNTHLSQIFI